MESIFLLYFKQQFSSYHVNSKLHQIYDFDGRNLDVIKANFFDRIPMKVIGYSMY